MGEQRRLASRNAHQPLPRPWVATAHSFEFPLGPAHQVRVDAPEERMQPGPVEAAVVVDPPLHDDVHHLCKLVQCLVTAAIDSPAPQLSTHRFESVATYRRQKVGKPGTSTHCWTGTKRVPQEVES